MLAEPARGPGERAALEAAIGHAFAAPALLEQALTHRSFLNETDDPAARDNERLEYLGDAVLGFVAGDHLFRALPDAPEGVLTALRAALVREATLAAFARRLGLGPALRLGRGEEATGGRERASVLCDAFEAVVGAVYLDGGLQAAAALLARFLEPELERVRAERRHRDARSELQELVQGARRETPRYATIEEAGPDHARRFTVEVAVGERVLGQGTGPSKAEAARRAALEALARLAGDEPPRDPGTGPLAGPGTPR